MMGLQTFSHFIGKAMNLPAIFFKPLPLPAFLDSSLPFKSSKGKRRAAKRRRVTPREQAAPAGLTELNGEITSGRNTRLSIGGVDFTVEASTWIIGEVRFGATARVKGTHHSEGHIVASSVVVFQPNSH